MLPFVQADGLSGRPLLSHLYKKVRTAGAHSVTSRRSALSSFVPEILQRGMAKVFQTPAASLDLRR